MSSIAITPQGVVSGSSDTLVAAAAELLRTIPLPRTTEPDRLSALMAAVRTPWDSIPVQTTRSAA
jgi:hypothetical protein